VERAAIKLGKLSVAQTAYEKLCLPSTNLINRDAGHGKCLTTNRKGCIRFAPLSG
jgi:hypothetical protein